MVGVCFFFSPACAKRHTPPPPFACAKLHRQPIRVGGRVTCDVWNWAGPVAAATHSFFVHAGQNKIQKQKPLTVLAQLLRDLDQVGAANDADLDVLCVWEGEKGRRVSKEARKAGAATSRARPRRLGSFSCGTRLPPHSLTLRSSCRKSSVSLDAV